MARGKKPGKGPENKGEPPRRIRFELEEDAEQIFLKHLEEFKPKKADAEELKEPVKKASRAQRAAGVQEVDLHGLNLEEAKQRVGQVVNHLRDMAGLHKLKVITGKGHHSKQGDSVLAKEIHAFVLATFFRSIVEIEDSPDQVRLAGIPLRGHFHVTILGKKS